MGTLARRGPNLSERQKVQLAGAVGHAAKAALKLYYSRQNNGKFDRDTRHPGKGGGRGRATVQYSKQLRMADNNLWRMKDPSDFQNQSTKALMQKAWGTSPATSNLMAPRGLGYYDAFASQPTSAMTSMSIGPATPIVGKTTCGGGHNGSHGMLDTANPNAHQEAQLLIVAPAPSSAQAVLYQISSSTVGTQHVTAITYHCPQFLEDPPVEAIPTRCSLRIGNYTSALNQGGIIRVLRMTTGILLDSDVTTNDGLKTLMEGIREHRRTVSYRGMELASDKQKNCIVADQSRSLAFQNWDLVTDSRLLPWLSGATPTFDVWPWTTNLYDPTYTPIAILFEPYTNIQPGSGGQPLGNSYQVVIQSQFLAHYKQGSMLANLAASPNSDANTINAHRDHEESKGSALEHIVHGIEGAAKFAWKNRGVIAPFVGQGIQALGRLL